MMATPAPNDGVAALHAIGFRSAGSIGLRGERLVIDIASRALAESTRVLYAFLVDGAVMYLGKSERSLGARMQNYLTPGPMQSTNIRVNARLRDAIARGARAELLAYVDPGTHRVGDFALDSAAGLESSLIRKLRPPWNGGARAERCAMDATETRGAVPSSQSVETGSPRSIRVDGSSHAERVLSRLSVTPRQAMCDDCLSSQLAIHPRQAINQVARRIEATGQIVREKMRCDACGAVKITNRCR